MDNFDVYLAFVEFSDIPKGKVRPVVLVEIETDKETVSFFGVYSYKEYWETDGTIDCMVKISDYKAAGIDKPESFIDISALFTEQKNELQKFKRLGQLSNNDIENLIVAINKRF